MIEPSDWTKGETIASSLTFATVIIGRHIRMVEFMAVVVIRGYDA